MAPAATRRHAETEAHRRAVRFAQSRPSSPTQSSHRYSTLDDILSSPNIPYSLPPPPIPGPASDGDDPRQLYDRFPESWTNDYAFDMDLYEEHPPVPEFLSSSGGSWRGSGVGGAVSDDGERAAMCLALSPAPSHFNTILLGSLLISADDPSLDDVETADEESSDIPDHGGDDDDDDSESEDGGVVQRGSTNQSHPDSTWWPWVSLKVCEMGINPAS